MTSDEEVERLVRLQKLRSRFRKPRRGSDLPRSAPICSGDEVGSKGKASTDFWTKTMEGGDDLTGDVPPLRREVVGNTENTRY